MKTHYIYIVVALMVLLMASSCASRRRYQEHTNATTDAVSHTSLMTDIVSIDSMLSTVHATADSMEIFVEPYIIPLTDSVGERVVVKIHSPTINQHTEKVLSSDVSVYKSDSVRIDTRADTDIKSDAQLSQDTGVTTVAIVVAIAIILALIIVAVVVVRR